MDPVGSVARDSESEPPRLVGGSLSEFRATEPTGSKHEPPTQRSQNSGQRRTALFAASPRPPGFLDLRRALGTFCFAWENGESTPPGRGILDHRPPRKSHQNIIVATRVWARSFDLVGSHRAELHFHLGFFFVAGNKERESIQWVCDQWSKTVVT